VYYEPNITAAPVRFSSIARITVVGGFLSLLLWSAIIALATSLILR